MSAFRILVGFDFSPLAEEALRHAFAQAGQRDDAEVHVVHVFSQVAELFSAAGAASVQPSSTTTKDDEGRLRAVVQAVYREWARDKVTSFQKLQVHSATNRPAPGILEFVEELDPDLIVVGTHGRGRLRRFLFGSVAEEVVKSASCPVLVVHLEPEAEGVPKIEPLCPDCVAVRFATEGSQQWCARHREHHAFAHGPRYSSRPAPSTQKMLY